ncbi:MAG: hypothetical protein AAGA56_12825 [Myxococcota bacterium]
MKSYARTWCGALALIATTGCAGFESRVEAAHLALDRGEPQAAIEALNEELDVESAKEEPSLEGDNALLILDRGTILQSIDDYELSKRDYGLADKQIDVLDFKRSTADDIGKYLFSDDVGPYRAPPFEKLLLNTFNMMNYLALHDLGGARVEGRRLAIMQKYLQEQDETTAMLGLGSYLAGFTFEKSGKPNEALRYYEEALTYDSYPSLRAPVLRMKGLLNGNGTTKRLEALVGDDEPLPSLVQTQQAELLVVVGYGRVPAKIPKRIPIGLALTLASGFIRPDSASAANRLAAKGLVTWINYPTLGEARGEYSVPSITFDGRGLRLEPNLDIEDEVRKEWKEQEGPVIASAITRMITRVIAGEAVQAGTNAAAGSNSGGGLLGLFAGLATSAALSAADTPDTRSWSTLPARVAIGRYTVPPGTHRVVVRVRGLTKTYRVRLAPGGWHFLVATSLR